jgi:ketosteroid isomerase-like protein
LRIQTSETLATPDAEMVLRVLEWALRDISIEVVRDGRRITVRGLGPSQRTMNRNDIAVVEVACEGEYSVIRGDIAYMASALLGGVPQDDLVRAKLDRVLDRVMMELGTKRVREEALAWGADPVREPESGFELTLEPEYAVAPEDTTMALEDAIEQKHVIEAEHGFDAVADEGSECIVVCEPVLAMEPVAATEIVAEREADVALPVASEIVPVEEVVEKPVPVAVLSPREKRAEMPMFQTFQAEDAKPPKRWGLLATVACMVVALALFLAWPYLVGLVHERLNPSPGFVEGSAGEEVTEATKHAADKSPMQMTDANAAAERDAAIHNESDPKVWLESWANAMRGQDASEQASFYADPMEHYALKSNVSNADVWLDKQNAIQSRPKGWTVQLEDVVVEPRPDESLRVRLTKHFTSQSEEGRASDQIIHSQLKLRKIDGQWKIVSEQNLRP